MAYTQPPLLGRLCAFTACYRYDMETPVRVTDIHKDGYRLFRQKVGLWYWVIVIAGVLIDLALLVYAGNLVQADRFDGDMAEGLLYAFFAPWILLTVIQAGITATVRQSFWKQFAADKGWTYARSGTLTGERGLMFREGHGRMAANVITGDFAGLPLRFFEYAFTVGSGKSSRSYKYTVFEFRFSGSFPHLYLNYKQDGYNISPGKELHLPEGLRQKFHLYAPTQYEIEALQVFSPDVLALIEDLDWAYDLELVEQELIVYMPDHVNTRGALEMEFARATALVSRLRPVLERMTLAKIGTNEPILSAPKLRMR